jgi:hypothetical protein
MSGNKGQRKIIRYGKSPKLRQHIKREAEKHSIKGKQSDNCKYTSVEELMRSE